jgi:hypothetical protein
MNALRNQSWHKQPKIVQGWPVDLSVDLRIAQILGEGMTGQLGPKYIHIVAARWQSG